MSEETIRALRREELDLLIDWAADEGWEPGRDDAAAFWAEDPAGFLGVELDGELVGAGSIVSYAGQLGFMGLFIVRPELRGRGIGTRLWFHRRDLLASRLRRGAPIGMDGVLAMREFYERGGFRRAHDHVRMAWTGRPADPDPDLVPLAGLPFDELARFDHEHFGAPRAAFLRRWIDPAGGLGLGLRSRHGLRGVGVVRPTRASHRIGPLFAEDDEVAERLVRALGGFAAGERVALDVPDRNAAALALASRHGMEETFRCARMYMGEAPPVPWDRVFAVTSLELG
jgi:GNAT superfamily N-acetyltransferase